MIHDLLLVLGFPLMAGGALGLVEWLDGWLDRRAIRREHRQRGAA